MRRWECECDCSNIADIIVETGDRHEAMRMAEEEFFKMAEEYGSEMIDCDCKCHPAREEEDEDE